MLIEYMHFNKTGIKIIMFSSTDNTIISTCMELCVNATSEIFSYLNKKDKQVLIEGLQVDIDLIIQPFKIDSIDIYERATHIEKLSSKWGDILYDENHEKVILEFVIRLTEFANKLYIMAADLGHLEAQLKAAHYFCEIKYREDCRQYHPERGARIKEDKRLAAYYYELAANQGSKKAMPSLIWMTYSWHQYKKAIYYLEKFESTNKCFFMHLGINGYRLIKHLNKKKKEFNLISGATLGLFRQKLPDELSLEISEYLKTEDGINVANSCKNARDNANEFKLTFYPTSTILEGNDFIENKSLNILTVAGKV